MALFEFKVEIPAAGADAADTVLLERGSANWSILQDAIALRAWLVGLGDSEMTLRGEWTPLAAALAEAGVTPVEAGVMRTLADTDWRESYKAHFHAWQFGRLHWVPIWEKPTFQVPPGDTVLWLDPGLAFGTGNHETTRLCIERLVAIDTELPGHGWTHESARIIDAGCGSGILALSAALLGYVQVDGFDNDPEAIRISGENAAMNGLQNRVRFAVGDLVSGLTGREAEVVMANIQADVLMRFARELVAAVAPGGVLILSGILAHENAAVRTAFEKVVPGWTVNARTMGEWSDVLLQRPRAA
ncbi:50S ribosomal protein L11 methyltransferase [Opitutus sp. ER46]|uniref:50S ribosomal protein L11 methyltransferase n=1 Tax=Opitutus sp. ER46 TaxID=2161864 RepID=UPI000D30D56D|nr:50S ribosomal protein L11 methyltransferase [Opitutus sp. ER46]PTX97926.1 50S ribosomal protein L11 methyltransferase [Opitutus sp. ER46]